MCKEYNIKKKDTEFNKNLYKGDDVVEEMKYGCDPKSILSKRNSPEIDIGSLGSTSERSDKFKKKKNRGRQTKSICPYCKETIIIKKDSFDKHLKSCFNAYQKKVKPENPIRKSKRIRLISDTYILERYSTSDYNYLNHIHSPRK